MDNIIAGRFQTQDQSQDALQQLRDAGFADAALTTFFVNPAGQHDLYPLGGDEDASPGAGGAAGGAEAGVAAGAAAGLAVGLAAAPFLGPAAVIAAAGVGAYTGSLGGTFSQLSSPDEADAQGQPRTPRRSGMLVAVSVKDGQERARAISVLAAAQAADIESASGNLSDGDWSDFDPRQPVHLAQT
jgi:hypothetical protein